MQAKMCTSGMTMNKKPYSFKAFADSDIRSCRISMYWFFYLAIFMILANFVSLRSL